MKRHHILPTTLLTALLLASGSVGAAPFAEVHTSGASIEFDLRGSLASHSLTVGGPEGYRVEQDFAAGEAPVFQLAEDLASGRYTWTLTENRVADSKRGAVEAEARSQSGTFTIEASGAVADPNQVEGGFNKATFVNDDEIVIGSACLGFDCTTTESYGADTVRFREPVLRVHFDDTSNSASFPDNDWRMVINDSSQTGGDYFAIEDATASENVFVVEAGAPNNAFYMEADGDVGLGTTEPAAQLHIVEGDSPSLRLDQDGSAGFQSHSWDLGGNESNFFIRDLSTGNLIFKTKPGSPDAAFYVADTGNVGLGTKTPDAELDIEGDSPHFRLWNKTTNESWDWIVNGDNNHMCLTYDSTHTNIPIRFGTGAVNNLFAVGIDATDQVTINGDLVVNGTITTPDYVFEPEFELESIEEHAEFMWREKHLPAVPAAKTGADGKGRVSLYARSQGALEELEKLHVYIDQLNNRLSDREDQLAGLQTAWDRMVALEQQLVD